MNNYDLPLPKMTNGNTEHQVKEITRYLFQLIDQLNWVLGMGGNEKTKIDVESMDTDEIVAQVKATLRREFTTLEEYHSIGLVVKDGMLCAIYNEEVSE